MARGSILIVNDCTAVRAALDAILRAQGYLVQTAKNGHDALAATEASAFDAVFVDLSRSARDSRDLARTLEARGISTQLIGRRAHPTRRCAPRLLPLPPRSSAPVQSVSS